MSNQKIRGLGEKPAHCPICCPDIPDGDDSDPTIAQMDEYGNFAPYVFPYTPVEITSNTIYGAIMIPFVEMSLSLIMPH